MCVRRKKQPEKKREKIRPTENTQRNPPQPGVRDFLETACDETRPTLWPILARVHRSRVCRNRPRTALEISKNDECYTYTDRQTHSQTNYIMAPCTHPGMKRLFCLKAKNGHIKKTQMPIEPTRTPNLDRKKCTRIAISHQMRGCKINNSSSSVGKFLTSSHEIGERRPLQILPVFRPQARRNGLSTSQTF